MQLSARLHRPVNALPGRASGESKPLKPRAVFLKPGARVVETCLNCGERAVVFVLANKWRCKKCGKYFDWTQIKGSRKT